MDADGARDRRRHAGKAGRGDRPAVKPRELFGLILATYKASFPYFLVIVLILLVVTWFLTEVAFVR